MIRLTGVSELIVSFADKRTEAFSNGTVGKGFPPDLVIRTRRALMMIDFAKSLPDLMVPPGNRLEKLSGNRKGQHSIRINDQWRICFIWNGSDAENVEIVDYH
jgi:toxin HigB-1